MSVAMAGIVPEQKLATYVAPTVGVHGVAGPRTGKFFLVGATLVAKTGTLQEEKLATYVAPTVGVRDG